MTVLEGSSRITRSFNVRPPSRDGTGRDFHIRWSVDFLFFGWIHVHRHEPLNHVWCQVRAALECHLISPAPSSSPDHRQLPPVGCVPWRAPLLLHLPARWPDPAFLLGACAGQFHRAPPIPCVERIHCLHDPNTLKVAVCAIRDIRAVASLSGVPSLPWPQSSSAKEGGSLYTVLGCPISTRFIARLLLSVLLT